MRPILLNMQKTDRLKSPDVINPYYEDIMNKNLIRYRKDCRVWQVNFTNPTEKNNRIRFNTVWDKAHKKEAYDEARKTYLNLILKEKDPEFFSPHTFQDAIKQYAEERGQRAYLDWLNKELGQKDIQHINKSDYALLIKQCKAQDNKNSTINRKLDVLKAILNLAVENEWIDNFSKIKKLPTPKDNIGYRLTPEDKQNLIKAMQEVGSDFLIDPFIFAFTTGLRKANVIGLKKSHILDTIHGKRLLFQASEMKANRTHSIPLTKSMVALIKRNITEDSEYVFRGYQGRETLGDFKKSWNRVKAVAGVSCRWHDLRHTCASELAESGMWGKQLKDAMAWSDIRMAERYTHLYEVDQLNLLERRETQFGTDLAQQIIVATTDSL